MERKVQMDDMARFRQNLMQIISFTTAPEPEAEEIHSIPMEHLQSSDASENISANETARQEFDIDGCEDNLDRDSQRSGDSGQQMMEIQEIQENPDNNLLRSKRLFIAKIIFVSLVAVVLVLAFSFLIYFFTKGKKKYIPHRENAVEVPAHTEKN